jgi:hypothetical protein
MTRRVFLILAAIILVFCAGIAVAWLFIRKPEESPKLPATPSAQAARISSVLLRARLEEMHEALLFTELQMKGQDLLTELGRKE